MKKLLTFGFLLMGFTFTVTQGLLIRELLVEFYGNELSIGLILGGWLILEAFGSGILGRLSARWGTKPTGFAFLQFLFALFLPICLLAAYSSRLIVGAIPGEGVGIFPMFWASFLILTPLALIDGAMFAFGSMAFIRLTRQESQAIGRVYVFEAVGAIMGGLLFTYLLIPFLLSLQIVIVLSGLNLLSAALIIAAAGRRAGKRLMPIASLALVLVLLVGGLVFSLSSWSGRAQLTASGLGWGGLDLIYSRDSVYGDVAVIQRENQYTFLADGLPILTSPVPDVVLSEELVHLPMSYIPEPERALVLSGGLGGVLHELAKYPLEEIVYAELDPLLIEAIEEFPTDLTREELNDPRLSIEHVDGRMLVRQISWTSPHKFDLVIVNLPYPSTLQLNRFYTVEFFSLVRDVLSEDGIVVIKSPSSLSYISDELRNLNNMVYCTMAQVYPHIRPIPGEPTLWMASEGEEIETLSVEELINRWESRGIETELLSDPYLQIRLNQQRLDWFWSALGGEDDLRETIVNRDLHPSGLFYGLSYWHAMFSPQMMPLFASIERLNIWVVSLLILGTTVVFVGVVRLTKRGRRAQIATVIGTTGFIGMTADLVLIFAFQSLYGYVYQWIGLFITAFMAGIGLGGYLMTRRLKRIENARRILIGLDISIVVYWLAVAALLVLMFAGNANPTMLSAAQVVLLLLNAVAGFLVGSQFPLANEMLLREGELRKGSVGFLYASDLLGAFLGSVAVSVVLIPVLGIINTCLLAALLKLASFLLSFNVPGHTRKIKYV
jgi:spermidine synthase